MIVPKSYYYVVNALAVVIFLQMSIEFMVFIHENRKKLTAIWRAS
jgi:hypothetical protein